MSQLLYTTDTKGTIKIKLRRYIYIYKTLFELPQRRIDLVETKIFCDPFQ